MTERVNAILVTLEHSVREDDVKQLVDAIGMMKWVLSVETNVEEHTDHIALQRARHELRMKIYKLLNGEE